MSEQYAFYHVFLSFKGEIREKFTRFLHEALKAKGYVAFMDKTNIGVGDGVYSTIKDGIKKSMSAIIIFSPDYASSTWCLDELVLILERNNNSRYFIIPLFYGVRTKDIKHQLGEYGSALEKHRDRHRDKVDKWRQALVEVGNLLGMHVEGPHNTFIRGVVELFGERLAAKFPELQSLKREPSKDKVIMYTTDAWNSLLRKWVKKKFLAAKNVVFEERNCSEELKYLAENPRDYSKLKYILELIQYDTVKSLRFPTVIVNGKDLCGDEEVEGLEDFEYKCRVVFALKTIYRQTSISGFVGECFEEADEFVDEFVDECFEEAEEFLDTSIDTVKDFFSS